MKHPNRTFENAVVTDTVKTPEGLTLNIHGVPARLFPDGETHYSQDVFERLHVLTRQTLEQNLGKVAVLNVNFADAAPLEPKQTLPNPISLEIARAIGESGLTHAEVAQRLGVSRPLVSRWTHPRYTGHTVETLERLAYALGKKLEVKLIDHAA
jgi:predicted XRE-type DNA-binding protein